MQGEGPDATRARWTPPWSDTLAWIESEVRRAGRRYRLPPGELDDIRQSLCMRVLESFTGYDPAAGGATLETWVRRHAAWGVADYWRDRLRREKRERPTDDRTLDVESPDTQSGESAAEVDEIREAVRDCLSKLTPTQRERVLAAEAAREASEPLQVLAKRVGVALDTLKEALARARVSLRKCLQRRGLGPASRIVPPGEPRRAV